jgi:hypothetical protein
MGISIDALVYAHERFYLMKNRCNQVVQMEINQVKRERNLEMMFIPEGNILSVVSKNNRFY